MDTQNLLGITELLMLAVSVAVFVKYVRLPYTVALVLVGFVVGFMDLFSTFHLSKDVILFVFLPPLLFEGTLNMDLLNAQLSCKSRVAKGIAIRRKIIARLSKVFR